MSSRLPHKLMAGLAALTLAVLGALAVPAAASAAPIDTDCQYANADGGGKYPTSICWIDFADFNSAEASSTDGQDVTVTMGDYTAQFNVIQRPTGGGWNPRNVVASPVVSSLGSANYYAGIGGSPLLYATSGSQFGSVSIQIRDFELTLGAIPVNGYSLVSASPETLDGPFGPFLEYIYWGSDVPMSMIDSMPVRTTGNGCALTTPGTPPTPAGNGTTSPNCAGAGPGVPSADGVIMAAPNATTITGAVYMSTPGEREAVAFGIQTARVTVDKLVDGRVAPADSFDLSLTSPEGPVLATTTTGTDTAASTGREQIVPSGIFTLAEVATTGSPSPLSYYDSSWSCTNATVGSTTVLPSGTGTSQSFTPAVGDDVTCVVTNAARDTGLSLAKTVDLTIAELGDTATYEFEVTNTGDIPVDSLTISEEEFSGTGTLSAVSCPTTTLAVDASTTCTATYVVTQADVDAGGVTNTALASARAAGTQVEVTSNESIASFGAPTAGSLEVTKTADKASAVPGNTITYTLTAANTGPVTLTDVTLTDTAFSGAGTLSALDCDAEQPAVLTPGESLTCTATYVVLAADKGAITNTATAEASDGSDVPLTDSATASFTAGTALAITGLPDSGALLGLAALLGLSGALTVLILRRRATKSVD